MVYRKRTKIECKRILGGWAVRIDYGLMWADDDATFDLTEIVRVAIDIMNNPRFV